MNPSAELDRSTEAEVTGRSSSSFKILNVGIVSLPKELDSKRVASNTVSSGQSDSKGVVTWLLDVANGAEWQPDTEEDPVNKS
jgi:hypothetical protein